MPPILTRSAAFAAALALCSACGKEQKPAAEAKTEVTKEPAKEAAKEAVPAEPAKEAAKEPAKEAPAAPMTPEKIKEMNDKAAGPVADKKTAANMALSALNNAALDDTKDAFKADQPAVDGAVAALGVVGSFVTNPTATPEDMAKFKADVLPELAQVARTGNSAVRAALAGSVCTALCSDAATLKGIDEALMGSTYSAGWQALYDCVTTSGPMEVANRIEKKTDYDRWSTLDRQAAIFAGNADPKLRTALLGAWFSFKGKNDKLTAALVAAFDQLDATGKSHAATVLGNTCAKDAAKPIVDKVAAAVPGTPEFGIKATLDAAFKACK